MKLIKTIYHYFAFIIKLILILIVTPFFFIFISLKSFRFKALFKRELRKSGMEKDKIKEMTHSLLSFKDLVKIIK